MPARRDRFIDTLVEIADAGVTPTALARAAVGALGVGAAAISLAGATGHHVLGAEGPLAAEMEDLQRAVGEGPTIGALARNQAIIALGDGALDRWPAFGVGASEAGVTSAAALPFRPRRVPPEALSLYSLGPDWLEVEGVGFALLAADLLAEVLTNPAPAGLRGRLVLVGDERTTIHVATGALSVRFSVTPAAALSLLRARAAEGRRSVADIAAKVIERQYEQG